LTFFAISVGRLTAEKVQTPPVAKIIPKKIVLHGDVRIDNYSWLRDRNDPNVMKYIEAENAYTEEVMKHTEPLQQKIYQELLARMNESDISVPEKIGDYYYYSRTEKGKQYPLNCRKKRSLSAEEEIILDNNELVKGHKALIVVIFKVSPNGQLLMYSMDLDGAESSALYVKDLKTGEVFDEKIVDVIEAEWANDNKTIFYVKEDPAKRPYKLYRHICGTDSKNDALMFHEKDEVFYLHLAKTKSNSYLVAWSESKRTSDVRYLEADNPQGDFKVFYPRQFNMLYSIDHHSDKFFIVTNDNAINFKLMETSVNKTSKENWREVIPARDKVTIEGIDAFKNYLVVYERDNGLKKIRISNLKDGSTYYIDFDEPTYSYQPARNEDFNSDILRFTYTSLVTPSSVYDYDMNTRSRELKKRDEVKGYDSSLFQSERIFARASDGAMVPISLVYKKGIIKDGKNPLLMEGYGSHGMSRDPHFDPNLISLLDRGFVYAIAHVRGGSEMGILWHENGKFLKKKNTFSDFVACAEHLISEKYTSKDKFAIRGGSSGGLLMGGVVNLKPELFKVVVTRVPFVDCLNTLLDPSLFLTTYEWEEYGNPNEKDYYFYIKSYAPYENVKPQNYPAMLITGGLNDRRVSYWEPLKWTAKLRALKTDKNLLLCKIYLSAGHGGPIGRYDALKEDAFKYAFIFDQLGIQE
jgi:oligopeptidase B